MNAAWLKETNFIQRRLAHAQDDVGGAQSVLAVIADLRTRFLISLVRDENGSAQARFDGNVRSQPDEAFHPLRHQCDAAFSALHFSWDENSHDSRNANDSPSGSNQNSERASKNSD